MIKITAVSYNKQRSLQPLFTVFGPEGGTLGRGADNLLVLPDPKNFVSRTQASIKSEQGKCIITNLSQANTMMLNGREVNFQQECELKAGDEIQIGLYVLLAEPHTVETANASPAKNHTKVAADITPESPPVDAGANDKQEQPSASDDDSASSTPVAADHQVLMQALLKGAGVPHLNLTTGLTPEFMEMIGKLLATSIQGTFDLMSSRALIKREAQADVTLIVVRNNNPLKFLSDSQTVLTQMLRKKMPGFMSPAEAMEEAYHDIRAHQSGVVAGMHAAIAEVLKRLNPFEIERRSKNSSIFDALQPAQRKGKMWDQYSTLFEEIQKETKVDFQKLFGQTFLDAYEKEIQRFENESQNK